MVNAASTTSTLDLIAFLFHAHHDMSHVGTTVSNLSLSWFFYKWPFLFFLHRTRLQWFFL